MKRFPFTPVLGWSATRYDMFNTCRRQYYYHYYGKHDSEFNKSRIDSLKSLRTIPMEIGTVVHDCLAELFKRLVKKPDTPVQQDRFLTYAAKQADIHAKERRYTEVHYRLTDKVLRSDIEPTVRSALANFLESERYQWIINTAIEFKDQWIIDPPGYGETRLGDLKAYSRVDFLIPADQEITILEWKSGKEREERHAVQLKGYASWALFHTGVHLSDIVPIVAYLLPQYHETSILIDEAGMLEFAELVKQQTGELYSMCADVQQNIPLAKTSFPMTDSLITCKYCNFRELCDR